MVLMGETEEMVSRGGGTEEMVSRGGQKRWC